VEEAGEGTVGRDETGGVERVGEGRDEIGREGVEIEGEVATGGAGETNGEEEELGSCGFTRGGG